jgi:hypothetical protein
MSDTFDHELDAYESLEAFGYRDAPPRRVFLRDPLYYHRRVSYDCVIHATEKAYLIQKEGKEFWVPKQLVASIGENILIVHRCYNWGRS